MKKTYILMGAVLAAALNAPALDDVVALKQQVNDLAAKIENLEAAQKAPAPELPAWVTAMKIKGDFRYRYENIEENHANTKDRQRVRLRVGAYGEVNDFVDFGVRLATGNGDETSANQTLSTVDGKTNDVDDAYFDLMYVDLHPEQLKGAHVIMGKMKQPWAARTGLIWDSDLNPEGIALTCEHAFTNGLKIMANAGSFIISDRKGDDTQLWSGQLVAGTTVEGTKLQLGVSDYYFENADKNGLGMGFNTAGSDFHLIEGFGSIGTKIADLPVKLYGQAVNNIEAEQGSQSTAYLVGVKLGKAKKPGSWELGYNWRDIERDAVVDGLHDSDFAGQDTGSYGHKLNAKYQIAKNFKAGVTWLDAVNGSGLDENTLQIDLNFKF